MLGRYLLISAGLLSVGTGLVGIFVPLLPTTPFLLLAAACFARSSERFHTWLIEHRLLGPYISNYRDHRGMTLGAKVLGLVAVFLVMAYNFFLVESGWLRFLFVVLTLGSTIQVLRLRTLPSRKPAGS